MKKKWFVGLVLLFVFIFSYVGYSKFYSPTHIKSYTSAAITIKAKHLNEQVFEGENQNGDVFNIKVKDKRVWDKLKEGKEYVINFETKDNQSTFVGFIHESN